MEYSWWVNTWVCSIEVNEHLNDCRGYKVSFFTKFRASELVKNRLGFNLNEIIIDCKELHCIWSRPALKFDQVTLWTNREFTLFIEHFQHSILFYSIPFLLPTSLHPLHLQPCPLLSLLSSSPLSTFSPALYYPSSPPLPSPPPAPPLTPPPPPPPFCWRMEYHLHSFHWRMKMVTDLGVPTWLLQSTKSGMDLRSPLHSPPSLPKPSPLAARQRPKKLQASRWCPFTGVTDPWGVGQAQKKSYNTVPVQLNSKAV